MEREIAKITGTHLGYEDHGVLTFYLFLDYGGAQQGAGGYALDQYSEEVGRRVGSAEGLEYIIRILRAVGVEKWEDLEGKTIYAVRDGDGGGFLGGTVKGIENLPTEPGERFMFDEVVKGVEV